MIYNIDGNAISSVFDKTAIQLNCAYDINGVVVFTDTIPWEDEISVQKLRDTASNTNYYVIRIPQIRDGGQKQYPFVYVPNGTGAGTQSTLSMNREKGFFLAINAGVFYAEAGKNPVGVTIENSVLIQQDAVSHLYALTIDEDGVLDYDTSDADGQALIASGIVSALVGFCPIIVNGQGVDSSIYMATSNYNKHAQRQIIGQFSNGDYCIVTGEGRSFDDSSGFTIPEAISVCEELGLEFAYNLDGGGSTETVIGDTQINTIYEGTSGRIVPSFIVFNGTDEFFIPNA